MTQSAKNTIKVALRLLLTPLRLLSHKHNGSVDNRSQRREIPNAILLGAVRDAIRQGHTATILVKGWSMRPFLEHQRDKVVLEAPSNVAVGDAVLAEIAPGTFVLHRIINIQGQNVTLMGDGNIRGTESCTMQDICGVVTQYIRPKRTIYANDKTLKRRIVLWRKLLPIRRLLLLFYKCII